MEISTFKIRIDKLRNLVRNFTDKLDEVARLKDEAYQILDELDKLEYDIKKENQTFSKRLEEINKKQKAEKTIRPVDPEKMVPKRLEPLKHKGIGNIRDEIIKVSTKLRDILDS
ncbi:MAG: hypothetical protein GF364_22230 [Candidatus Lokiarchaeota archaeon]|nr:hypothetical protein [Candidatus Lokiarchaeota archaeon]